MTQSSYRNIIAIALPVMIANLAMPIQSVIDIAIVGHFNDISQLAGMGIAIQLIAMLLVSFNFLQYASSGLSAQAVGKHTNINTHNSELFAILQRALMLAIILGVTLMALQRWLIPIGLHILGAKNGIVDNIVHNSADVANQYVSVRMWGVVAELMNYAFLGWFAGQGKTKLMLYQQSFIACANIVLTVTLVYGFDMHIEGVALGTTLAYWLGIGLAIIFACQSLNMSISKFFSIDKARFTVDKLMTLFSLNRDIFIRTMVLTFSFAWITRLSAMSGDIILAVNAILLQVLSLSAYALDGLAVATETLTGQHQGQAKKELADKRSQNKQSQNKPLQDKQIHLFKKNFKQILMRTFLASFSLAFGLSIIWWLSMPTYLSMMTNLSEVYQMAYHYRWYAILLPVIGVGAYWVDGVFFGLTDGFSIRNASIIVALIFFPNSWLVYTAYGMTGIWLSIWFILLLRFFVLSVMLIFKLKQ